MTDCWLYGGLVDKSTGYGRVVNTQGYTYAHRAMYETCVGPIPDGMTIDHLCRVRSCVNPSHMEVVTRGENVRRGEAGKYLKDRTHCPYGHPYSGSNVIVRRDRGWQGRDCRACTYRRNQEHRQRIKIRKEV